MTDVNESKCYKITIKKLGNRNLIVKNIVLLFLSYNAI